MMSATNCIRVATLNTTVYTITTIGGNKPLCEAGVCASCTPALLLPQIIWLPLYQ